MKKNGKGIGLAGSPAGTVMHRRTDTSRPGNVQPTAKSSPTPKPGTDEHYRATSDMETLRSAEQIKQDSKRHGAAKAVAAQHIQSLVHVTGDAGPAGKMTKKR